MLQAVVARCPYFGGKLISFDSAKAMQVPGVRNVVPVTTGIAPGVAVVADHTWAAMKGRDALQVQWERGADSEFDSQALSRGKWKTTLAQRENGYFVRGDGDAPRGSRICKPRSSTPCTSSLSRPTRRLKP